MPRIKSKTYSPVALRPDSTQRSHILSFPLRISDGHLLALEETEEEFDCLNNELVGAAAPLFSAIDFGCSLAALNPEDGGAQEHELQRFPLPLYRAICAAKLDFAIDEFDPCSLTDGAIERDTYEADMMEDLPLDLQSLFITCLTSHLTLKRRDIAQHKWNFNTRYQRQDADFTDNSFLRTLLFLERPFGNSMINEYRARRDLSFEALKAAYFHARHQNASNHRGAWLTSVKYRDINFHYWTVFDLPMQQP